MHVRKCTDIGKKCAIVTLYDTSFHTKVIIFACVREWVSEYATQLLWKAKNGHIS